MTNKEFNDPDGKYGPQRGELRRQMYVKFNFKFLAQILRYLEKTNLIYQSKRKESC